MWRGSGLLLLMSLMGLVYGYEYVMSMVMV